MLSLCSLLCANACAARPVRKGGFDRSFYMIVLCAVKTVLYAEQKYYKKKQKSSRDFPSGKDNGSSVTSKVKIHMYLVAKDKTCSN